MQIILVHLLDGFFYKYSKVILREEEELKVDIKLIDFYEKLSYGQIAIFML